MTTLTLNQPEAIKNSIAKMSPGDSLLYQNVSWSEYKQLTDELTEWPGKRLTFDGGCLEIMSPLAKHEQYKELLSRIGTVVADEMEIDIECLGSTTFTEDWLDKGTEPDTCFYIANAAAIIGKRRIDLNIDPPPDIAVEVDITNPSIRKLSIYEAMHVPEVWLYNEKRLRIFLLGEKGYELSTNSRSFPVLTSEALTQTLEQSKTQGQSAALRTFRKWLKTQLALDV
jgi:Uma2 family endonuclease